MPGQLAAWRTADVASVAVPLAIYVKLLCRVVPVFFQLFSPATGFKHFIIIEFQRYSSISRIAYSLELFCVLSFCHTYIHHLAVIASLIFFMHAAPRRDIPKP